MCAPDFCSSASLFWGGCAFLIVLYSFRTTSV